MKAFVTGATGFIGGNEFGLPQNPTEGAIEKSIRWFKANEHVR